MSDDKVNPIAPIPSNQQTDNDKPPKQDTPATEKKDDTGKSSGHESGITRDDSGNITGVDTHI